MCYRKILRLKSRKGSEKKSSTKPFFQHYKALSTYQRYYVLLSTKREICSFLHGKVYVTRKHFSEIRLVYNVDCKSHLIIINTKLWRIWISTNILVDICNWAIFLLDLLKIYYQIYFGMNADMSACINIKQPWKKWAY